jgi:hypothetical protein
MADKSILGFDIDSAPLDEAIAKIGKVREGMQKMPDELKAATSGTFDMGAQIAAASSAYAKMSEIARNSANKFTPPTISFEQPNRQMITSQNVKFSQFTPAKEPATEKLDQAYQHAKDNCKAIDASTTNTNDKFAMTLQHVETMKDHTQTMANNIADMSKNGDKFNKSNSNSASTMHRMAQDAKDMAGRIKDTTLNLIRWSGIVGLFTGVAGAGSLFGINRMAQDIGNDRRRAMGLNVSTGQYNAANIEFSRALSDPASTLGSIRDAQADLSKRWAFQAMNVNPNVQNPLATLTDLIKSAKNIFTKTGGTTQGAEAFGLTQFFTIEDLTRFKNMSDAEIDAMGKSAQSEAKKMEVNDTVNRKWQDFAINMEDNGKLIRNVFEKDLLPLEPQLTQLSNATVHLIDVFMTSPLVKQGLQDIADGIGRLAVYIQSDSFKKDLMSAETEVRNFATVIKESWGVIKELFGIQSGDEKSWNGSPREDTVGDTTGGDPSMWNRIASTWDAAINKLGTTVGAPDLHHNPTGLRSAPGVHSAGGFAVFDRDEMAILATAQQLHRYFTGERYSPKTHQLVENAAPRLTDIKDMISTYAPKADHNDTDAYIKNVVAFMQTNVNKDITSTSTLNMNDMRTVAALVAAMAQNEGKSKWGGNTEAVIQVLNNTGGSAHIAAAQLAN